jgi:hypothetical protein
MMMAMRGRSAGKAYSSSDKPGSLMLSRLKLKGAEICRMCELRFSFVAAAAAVATFDLEPTKRCSFALKLLRSMQAMVAMAAELAEAGWLESSLSVYARR